MEKRVLYIGNDLTTKSKYNSTMETLSHLLRSEKFTIYKSSSNKNKIFRLIEMCLSVFKYRNRVDYVLIDTFSTLNFYFALITSQLSRIFKINYIPILHGGNLPYRLDTSKYFSELIFKNSYKNVAPSGYLKYEFEKRSYKTILIPNVIQIEEYVYKDRVNLQPNLLYVRAFDKIYNSTMAIEVLAKLKEKYSNAKLCMIGPDRDGSLADVKKLIEKKGLIGDVEFTGTLSQKEWHQKSEAFDIFINTTNIDNTPVSVLEAMALGLPVVSTNVGGIPYLIDDLVDGLLVEKGNVKQMISAIKSILEGNHKEMTKNARKKIEKFGWDLVKTKWFEILK